MIPCLSPNGQTTFELDRAPVDLLVGSSTGVVRLSRSHPGMPWVQRSYTLAGKHIGALINGPDGALFAGCHHRGGLFRSTDDANSWDQIGQDIVATDFFSLALLDGPDGPLILAGVEPVNLYCSPDGGDTWEERDSISIQPGGELWSFPPPPHLPHLKSITINGAEPNSFFACVEQGALLRTDDGGKQWVELAAMWRDSDMAYRDAHRIAVAPWNPMLLVFASGVGVYRSVDGGQSWERSEQIGARTKYPDVLVMSTKDRAIFVGGPIDVPGNWPRGDPTGNLCRSLDEGVTWQPLNTGTGFGANFEALSIVSYPGGYELFAGDTMGRIYSSADAGDSWQLAAATSAISKGAHHKLADMSVKLPRWAGIGITALFNRVTYFTKRRAAARRRSEFARRTPDLSIIRND